jgi:mannitol PTS system EIIA component
VNVLVRDAIRLGSIASSRDDAILQAGRALEETGAVDPGYADAMLERERGISTSVGEGFAIPHGTDESRVLVRRTALSFIQFPAGVDWDADRVYVCIGIAARDDAHLGILAQLADTLIQPELAASLREATDPDEVLAILEPTLDQDDQGEPPAGDQP